MNERMKELPEEERPYEKFYQKGVSSLTDAELLAIILRTGSRSQSALALARKVLGISKENPGLLGLNYLTAEELSGIDGIGRVKAAQLLCIAELSGRMAKAGKKRGPSFQNPEQIAGYYMQSMRFLTHEVLMLLLLNNKSMLIKDVTVSIGTVNASVADPREIFIQALKHGAVFIILVHNHPSGDPSPSREDIRLTRQLLKAGNLVGIGLSDHIIIGDNRYVSLREQGYI